ncbi:MAG TPA: hypothetical protein VG269_00725 [Tepidisphaeraceae bacterium]|nr:hypothetical protein [Tepidisphaeraceae bacterium]
MDIDIRESNHGIPQRTECLSSTRVVFFIAAMRFAVNLDDQLGLRAIEIRDIPVNPHLASELESIQSAISQAIPKLLFGGRRLLPHSAGEVHQLRINTECPSLHRRTSTFRPSP